MRQRTALWLLALAVVPLALAADPFAFSSGVWTPLNTTGDPQPSARRWHTVSPFNTDSFILFGGREDSSSSGTNGTTSTNQLTTRYMNDMWQLTFTSDKKIKWKQLVKQVDDLLIPSGRPAARFAHTAIVRKTANGRWVLVVYGGYSPLCGDYCADMWEFDIEAKTWQKWERYTGSSATPAPYTLRCSPDRWIGRRWRHVAEGYGKYMLVFGGFRSWTDADDVDSGSANVTARGFLNDLWEIDFDARTATRMLPTAANFDMADLARASPGSVLVAGTGDGKTGTMYIFGGFRSSSTSPASGVWFGDLYSYSHAKNEWRLLTYLNPPGDELPAPTVRYGAVMFAYGEVIGAFGGRDAANVDLDEVWFYNLTSRYWTEYKYKALATVRGLWPAGRSRHSGASFFDSRFAVFGGSSGGSNLADPWLLDLDRCKAPSPSSPDCSGHGSCVKGYCVCDTGYFGLDCSGRYCADSSCFYDYVRHTQSCTHCSGKGTCDGATVDEKNNGLCVCKEPRTGYTCELTLCPQDCTVKDVASGIPRGTAPFILQYGRIANWDYDKFEPYANGKCSANGTCDCIAPFTGQDCSLRRGCMDKASSNFDSTATISAESLCKFTASVLPRSSITLTFNISCMDFLRDEMASNVTDAFNQAFQCANCYISDVKCGSTIVTMVIGDTLSSSDGKGLSSLANDPQSSVNVASSVYLYLQNSEKLQAFKDLLTKKNIIFDKLMVDGSTKPKMVLPNTAEQRQALTKQKLAAASGSTTAKKKEEPTSYLWVFGLVWLAVFIIP